MGEGLIPAMTGKSTVPGLENPTAKRGAGLGRVPSETWIFRVRRLRHAGECEQRKNGWILAVACIACDAPSEVVGKRTAFGSNGAVQQMEFCRWRVNRSWAKLKWAEKAPYWT